MVNSKVRARRRSINILYFVYMKSSIREYVGRVIGLICNIIEVNNKHENERHIIEALYVNIND